MKKLIIKIALAFLAIAFLITSLVIYNKNFKDKKNKDNPNIEVNIVLIDIEGKELLNDFYNGYDKTLFDILNDNYKIRYDESIYGIRLLDFESVKTDFTNTYIAIYVDESYSTKGISYITLYDKIKIEFKETKIL